MFAKLVFLLSLSAAPKHHVVTGVYPSAELTYAPWVLVQVAYPEEAGRVTTYMGTFHVAEGPLVRKLLGRRGDHLDLRVTLERDGETGPWTLTRIARR